MTKLVRSKSQVTCKGIPKKFYLYPEPIRKNQHCIVYVVKESNGYWMVFCYDPIPFKEVTAKKRGTSWAFDTRHETKISKELYEQFKEDAKANTEKIERCKKGCCGKKPR